VKLRGRARRQAALGSNEALKAVPKRPEGRRGRTLSFRARGAKQNAHHGPLQRLLEVAPSTARAHRLRGIGQRAMPDTGRTARRA
jgi:hypothetical protein